MKRIYMAIITILCSIGIAISIAQAWFINGFDVDPLATGSSTEAYYHSGTGTQSDPYIITTPRHLYNLAWLQYLGTYNKDKKNGLNFPATYFKIGTSAGITIDMTGWPLPPIGTAKYPFIGNFNGNGATILNLTSTNNFTEFGDKHPSGVDNLNFEADYCGTVGFFGAIGAYNANIISESDSTNDNYTYDTTNNKAYNFYLNNTNVHTCRSTTLIGTVAGYVNAKIEDVGVIQPHLNIQASASSKLASKTSNLSDFAVVGYAEEQYTTQKTKTSTIIYNPTYDYSHFNFKGMGSQADWGGSLNFANTYQRIYDIVKSVDVNTNKYTSANVNNFVGSEIQYYKVVDGLSVIDEDRINVTNAATEFTNFASTSPTEAIKYYNYGNANGSYLRTVNSSDSDQFMVLSALYKDVIIVTKTEDTESGYVITDSTGEIYLNIVSTRTNGTLNYSATIAGQNNAVIAQERVWVLSGTSSGYLYTYNENDGKKYYLNATTSALSVSSSESGRTTWYYDSANNGFYFTSGGFNYYLKYYNGQWCTTPLYVISDNNGNYLKMSGTNNEALVTNTTTASEATVWDIGNGGSNPTGAVRTINGTYTRYLNINSDGNLVTTSSTVTWSNSGSGLYNGTNYIQFKNGYWVAEPNPSYKIGFGAHYLSVSGTDTNEANAAMWTLSDNLATDGGYGTISVRINGVLNYLGNDSGLLNVSDNEAVWTNIGNVFYNFGENQIYCLQYDNGWKLIVIDYYIVDQSNNYLSFNDSTTIRNETSPTTLWHFSNATNYPQGFISCQNNNNTYYLDHNGTNISLSSSASTNWYNDGSGLYCIIDDIKHYLVFDTTWKLVSYTYKISNGTNYLSIDNNGDIITTNEASATNWVFSNSGTNPSGSISSNGYYLYLDNNGVLTTTTNSSNALSFSNDGSKLYNGYNSIQYYGNQWLFAKAFDISYNNTYLGFGGTIGTSGSTTWFYYNNEDFPSGYIYTIYNNVRYYLYKNGTSLAGNQTNKTNWSNEGSGVFTGTSYIQWVNGSWVVDTLKYHYIKNGNNYLRVNNNNLANATSISNATLWTFSNAGNNPSGTISYNKKYLYANRSYNWGWQYTVSYSSSSSNWTNSSGKLNSNNCGLRNSGTTWDATSSGNGTTFTFVQPIAMTSDVYSYEDVSTITSTSNNRNNYAMENYDSISLTSINKRCYTSQTYANYEVTGNADAVIYTNSGTNYTGNNALPSAYSAIPITTKGDKAQTTPSDYSTGNNYVVDESNTGYIISGGHETRQAADVRISQWNQTGNNFAGIPSNLIQGSFSGGTLSNVYTVTTSGNTYAAKQITESTVNGVQTNDCGFSKYFASKSTMQQTLASSSKLYGAHFMNAPISKNKYVIMPEVVINGDTKTNFQMPEDCIDFTLKSKGIINFFSSYFYSNSSDGGANNCFFSLNEIIRDANGNISQIRHILYVYENNSDGTYVYQYQDADNTSITGYYTKDRSGNIVPINSFNASEYTLKYNANWIEDPAQSGQSGKRASFYGTVSGSGSNKTLSAGGNGNRIFYFEIPVNVGEYALGSVSKRDYNNNPYNGAYILYLDIGANASVVDRTTITQQSDVVNEELVYASGIQLLASGSTFSGDSNTAVAIIEASTTGAINISRTGNTISFGGTSLNSSYWDEALTVPDGTLDVDTNTITSKVLKYIDFNNGTGTLYYATVIDSGGNQTYEVREIDGNTNPVIATNESANPESLSYGLLKIGTGDNAGYGVADTASGAISANTFATTSKTVEYYYFIPTSVITNDGVNYSFDMNVSQVSGTVTIGGFNISSGTYTFNDGYTSTHCYKLDGDAITYVFTQIPTGTTTTTFVVSTKDGNYTVTINGTTISVGNYTYTFSTNTIASS